MHRLCWKKWHTHVRQTDRFDVALGERLLGITVAQIVSLTFNRHIKTADQRTIIQQYGDWYTGR